MYPSMMSQVTSMTLALQVFVVANVPLANLLPPSLLLSLSVLCSHIFFLTLMFLIFFLSFFLSVSLLLFLLLLPFSSSYLESSVVCCIARARIDAAWILELLPNSRDSLCFHRHRLQKMKAEIISSRITKTREN